jgi:hypothetical protein
MAKPSGPQDNVIPQPNTNAAYESLLAAGIPTSAALLESDSTIDKKEIVYKELDRIPVTITDVDPDSPNYLRVTYLPSEFSLGKNLIRIRPNIPVFAEESQLHVEIIDYNGDPIYYEIEINSETKDLYIIISVYIYEDTPPGPCAVYILGTLKNVTVPDNNKIYPVNFRWTKIINIDTSEKTKSPIIFTTLPKIAVIANTGSYDIVSYSGGAPFTSSYFYNVYLHNGFLNPSITALETLDVFNSAMSTGKLYAEYEDIQLLIPNKFSTTNLLGGGVTASIQNYLTSKSLTLEEPIVIYQQNKVDQIILESAIFKTASIAYEQDPSGIVQSTFKKRIVTVNFTDLDPFVGQIRNVKTLYRDTALKTTEYLLLSDFIIPSTNVPEGFNPPTASFSLVLPDSEIDEHYDIRFEFYNNETVPSLQVLEVRDIIVPGIPDVVVNNNGILMVNPSTSVLDGKNLVRTLYQDYDIHTLYTSSLQMLTGSSYPTVNSYKSDQQKSITQFTAFIPDGASYVTAYYNAAVVNLSQKTLTQDLGYYNYNVMLSVYEMSTSSYTNFSYDTDEILLPKVLTSTASITMYSGDPANQTAFAYPIKHTVQLPETGKLYRFSLEHNITVTGSISNINSASFNVSCSIKDIDILSSGFLFISGARPTYVSGAHSYNIPSI